MHVRVCVCVCVCVSMVRTPIQTIEEVARQYRALLYLASGSHRLIGRDSLREREAKNRKVRSSRSATVRHCKNQRKTP